VQGSSHEAVASPITDLEVSPAGQQYRTERRGDRYEDF